MNGTLLWGYVLSNILLPGISVSNDDKYVTFTDNSGNHVYLLNQTSMILHQYSSGTGGFTADITFSPNSSLILVAGWLPFVLFDLNMNAVVGPYQIVKFASQCIFVSDDEFIVHFGSFSTPQYSQILSMNTTFGTNTPNSIVKIQSPTATLNTYAAIGYIPDRN